MGVMHRSDLQQTDDTELIVRAAEGDREAFGALYERYALKVFRRVHYLTSDTHTAEDLTAQTFLKALEAIHRYEIRGVPFLAWLFRIAYNLTVSHRRARKNGTPGIPGVDVHGSLHTPEASCVARADSEWVWEAVRRLKGHQRQVIVMRFVDGLSYSEAARVLGRQVNAVRVIQHRALRALRRRLQDNLGQPLR